MYASGCRTVEEAGAVQLHDQPPLGMQEARLDGTNGRIVVDKGQLLLLPLEQHGLEVPPIHRHLHMRQHGLG